MNMKKVLGFTVSPRGSGGQGQCPWPGQGVLGVEVRVRDSEAVVGIYWSEQRIAYPHITGLVSLHQCLSRAMLHHGALLKAFVA